MQQSSPPKPRKEKRKKNKIVEENPVDVRPPLLDLEYPEHLSKVNYLALDSFEAAMEDQLTHQTYHQVIMQNQHLFTGKTVLHITEGSNCLYSIFAAQAGSRKVYCVVNGDSSAEIQSAYMMREIVKENNLDGIVEVLCWREFNAEVDIILGEPMGYCLHFDGMLDRIIEARDLYLTKRGLIFPSLLSFKCALIHD
jgi:type I protein arginine methyltransferase